MFEKSTTQYTPMLPWEDADGKVWIRCRAHDDLTAKTPYKVILDEYGYITAALADDVYNYYVGVPEANVDSGDFFKIQIGGYVYAMITPSLSVSAGHALSIYNGAVADAGADYSGADGQFAVNQVATDTATIHNVILVPERVKATT